MSISPPSPPEAAAAELFDQWAQSGRAESMAEGHQDVTGQLLDHWGLKVENRVLDVGCGNGWAVRWMLEKGAGTGTGVDISPAMIERASQGPGKYLVAGAANLPFDDNSFSHILSVEALYYHPDPLLALKEWRRVAAPGAQLGVIVDLYTENPATHAWVDALDIPVSVRSEAEYAKLAKQAGWNKPRTFRLHDRRPAKPESAFTPSPYWPRYADYLDYRAQGSLALIGSHS